MNKERKINLIFLLSLILIVFVVLNGVSATDTNLTTVNNTGVLTGSIAINDNGNQSSNDLLVQSDNYSNNYPETLSVADMKTVCNGSAQLKSSQQTLNNSNIINSENIYTTTGNNQLITNDLTLSNYNEVIVGQYMDNQSILNTVPKETFFKVYNLTNIYNNKSNIYCYLLSSNNQSVPNENISFIINGSEFTTITNDEGYAYIPTNYNIGIYNVTYNFAGDENYSSATNSSLLTVRRAYTFINGSDISMYPSDTQTFNVTLKDEYNSTIPGAKVIFTINGINYENETNSEGVTTITLPQLPIGTYVINYTYFSTESSSYDTSSGSNFISVSNGNFHLSSNGQTYLSLKDAIANAQSTDTITIDNGTYYGSNNMGLTINKDLIIKAATGANVIFDATNFTGLKIFVCSFQTVTLSDLTFSNHYAENDTNDLGERKYGIVSSLGNLTINNCTFVNNTHPFNVIFPFGTNLTLMDCKFISNNYHLGRLIELGGGDLNSSTIMKNCLFLNNDVGTVIFNTETKFDLINTSLINNTGFYALIDNIGINTVITNSTFRDNNYASIITNYKRDNLVINNTNFINNSARREYTINNQGNLTINNSNFNASFNKICVALSNSGNCTINNSIFNNFQSEGAIFNSGNCTINNSIFNNNTGYYGGAIYNNNSLIVNYSTFTNNIANSDGGAIYSNTSNINITYSVFYNNTASTNGYDLYIINGGNFDFNWWGDNTPFNGSKKIFVNNQGYVSPNNWVIMTLTSNITNPDYVDVALLTVSLNSVNSSSGIVNHLPDDITLPNRTVIFTSDNGSLNPESSSFTNSTSSVYTSTSLNKYYISATVDNQVLTINNTIKYFNELYVNASFTGKSDGTINAPFKNITSALNYANIAGHNVTIYIMNGTYNDVNMLVSNNVIISNYANGEVILNANHEGCIFYNTLGNNLTVNGLTFVNGSGYKHYSTYHGGAIYSEGNLFVNNSNFINNTLISGSGGAINSNYGNLSVIGSNFINNTAGKGSGGAIDSSYVNLIVSGSNFINNTAIWGGAICSQDNNMIVSSSSFVSNKGAGGAINAQYCNLSVNSSIFLNNIGSKGDAISSLDSNLSIDYNWWGNNTPFVGENKGNLIFSITSGSYISDDNWVIMGLSINSDNVCAVTLNQVNNTKGVVSNLPDNVVLPIRNVMFSSNVGNFDPSSNLTDSNGVSTSIYVLGSLSVMQIITATVDNQNLNIVTFVPDVLYVNGSSRSTTVDGSLSNPFHNITSALDYANIAGHNVTIYIMNGTYNDVNMTITNNLTISTYENANVIIDAEKKGYIFYDDNINNALNIIGLTFTNATGYIMGDGLFGGAIFSNAKLNIINSTFNYNTATYGGAVLSSTYGNIINSTFNYNTATYGGALVFETFGLINGSYFYNNTASKSAGAIVFDECGGIISNSEFINNKALNEGVISGDSYVNITGCLFKNNNGENLSGVICAQDINVTGSAFINNTSKFAKDIFYTHTVYADYNWWGNNTPFTNDNKLILYAYSTDASDIEHSKSVNASNWVIMALNANTDNVTVNSNIVLTVTLNTTNSTEGIINNLPSNISLPALNVTFTSNSGNFNPYGKSFTNKTTSEYTATTAGINVLSATIDNQTLNITVIVNSNVVISPISTSIVNTQLISYVNGSVIVYVVDGGNIVNVGNVNVLLNNKAIGSGNVHNGQAIINITGVDVGNYNVTVFYFGKEPFESTSKILPLTILTYPKENVTINVPNIIVKPGVNSTINVNLTDNDNNPINEGTVSVNVDGVNYTANVINGSAIINYTAPNTTGVYNITVTYINGTYSTTVGSIINVTNITNFSVLVGYNLTESYGQGLNYTGILSDALGNPIAGQHIALNLTRLSDGKSKVYWVTTDTFGEYQLAINLSPGNYTVQASYCGNNNYSGFNASVNSIVVLNANFSSTVLSANNFTHPFGAGLNFTGKLLDGLGNPVMGQHIALNLTRLDTGKSKVYWVTTDTFGEYQLAINLWTANYTVQCSYAGSSQYSSSSANATITVTSKI